MGMGFEEIAGVVYGSIMAVWAIFQGESLERKRKCRLQRMLSDPKWDWRSLTWLSASIGADQETTKRLLMKMGARPRPTNSQYWGLESRVGRE